LIVTGTIQYIPQRAASAALILYSNLLRLVCGENVGYINTDWNTYSEQYAEISAKRILGLLLKLE
jgi:hypothetical protein